MKPSATTDKIMIHDFLNIFHFTIAQKLWKNVKSQVNTYIIGEYCAMKQI